MGIYKIKGSPYFWYDFSIKGTRFRDSTKTDNRADALALEAATRRKVILGEHYKDAETHTLTAAFARYWEERAQFHKSRDSIKAHVLHMLNHFGKDTPLQDIGQAEMASYVAKCRTETHTRKGWKQLKPITPALINRRISTFQGMHNEARLTWGVTVKNINFKRLKLKEPPAPDNSQSRETMDKWLRESPDYIRDFTFLAIFSGLRKTNILTLRGEDLDLKRRVIQRIGKGDKQISVPIVDELYRYIMTNKLHERDWVITYNGKPVKDIKRAWNSQLKRLGLSFNRHAMRHTCGTWIYERTGDILAVKEHLHHADIKTSERYTHTKKDKQLAKLNKALSPNFRQTKLVKGK